MSILTSPCLSNLLSLNRPEIGLDDRGLRCKVRKGILVWTTRESSIIYHVYCGYTFEVARFYLYESTHLAFPLKLLSKTIIFCLTNDIGVNYINILELQSTFPLSNTPITLSFAVTESVVTRQRHGQRLVS